MNFSKTKRSIEELEKREQASASELLNLFRDIIGDGGGTPEQLPLGDLKTLVMSMIPIRQVLNRVYEKHENEFTDNLYRKKLDDLQKKTGANEASQDSLGKELENIEKQMEDIQKTYQEDLKKIDAKKQELGEQKRKCREALAAREQEIKEKEEDLKSEEKKLQDLKEKSEKIQGKIEESKKGVEALEKQKEQLNLEKIH